MVQYDLIIFSKSITISTLGTLSLTPVLRIVSIYTYTLYYNIVVCEKWMRRTQVVVNPVIKGSVKVS